MPSNILLARTVLGIPSNAYKVPYRNIGELLKNQSEIYDDKTWLIFCSDEPDRSEYSYKQFYELVCREASFLLTHGVLRGDRIATVAYNHLDTVVQYFAAWLM